MQIFKKRGVVITAAVIVMIIAALFGVHRSVGSAAKKVEKMFYDGVYLRDEGYRQTSIGSQLDQRTGAAMTLWSIASNYSELADEAENLRASRASLIEADSISDKYGANRALEAAVQALASKLDSAPLDERDRAEAENCLYTMASAQGLIEASGYNDEVANFTAVTMNAFPVKYLKALAFCRYPEYFANKEL